MILETIEPFGERGAWTRSGILSALFANANRGKHTPAFKSEDFMPETMKGETNKAQTPEQMYRLMMLLKERQDAYLERKKREEAERNGGHSGA